MITFHKARVDEVNEIKKLLYKSWISTYSSIYSPEQIESITSDWHSPLLLTKQIRNPDIFFEVVKKNNKIIGMCNAILTHKGTTLNIQRLHISPDYQNQGIGSQLINKAIRTFPKISKVSLEVEEQNHKALSFYQKHGFTEVKNKIFVVNNIRIPCIIMEKLINEVQ